MNILVSANNYPYKNVQLQAFIEVVVKEMTRQGHYITVIAPCSLTSYIKHGYSIPPYKYKDKITVGNSTKEIIILRPYSITFGNKNSKLSRISTILERFIITLTATTLKQKPDLIYAHFLACANNIYDYAKNKKIPLFVGSGEDTIIFNDSINWNRLNNIKNYISGLIAVSTKNRDECFEKKIISDKTPCAILPNSVDTKEFYYIDKQEARQKLGFDQHAFIVAFCGRFSHRKGVLRVSEAIKKLDDENIKSIFIGELSEGLTKEPDCDGILFKGVLEHNKIVNYLNCADVFVLPTLAEGCSNSIVEAMACGLPIISSDLPFNYDILNKDNAILINPMDVNQIADAIKTIKNNSVLRKKMAYASIQRFDCMGGGFKKE